MVRHYGLYSRTKKVEAKVAQIKTLGEVYEGLKAKRLAWRYRIMKYLELIHFIMKMWTTHVFL